MNMGRTKVNQERAVRELLTVKSDTDQRIVGSWM